MSAPHSATTPAQALPAAPAADADAWVLLRDPHTIRRRCAAITAAVADERSGWFRLDRSRLPDAAAHVLASAPDPQASAAPPPVFLPPTEGGLGAARPWGRSSAPGDLAFPGLRHAPDKAHSRRQAELDALLAPLSAAEGARARFDLALIGALLDTEPGSAWAYSESTSGGSGLPTTALPAARAHRDELLAALDAAAAGKAPAARRSSDSTNSSSGSDGGSGRKDDHAEPDVSRSEGERLRGAHGVSVACLRAFMAGAFSTAVDQPGRVDAEALRQIDAAALRDIFQAGSANALVGLEGRAAMLVRLGQVLQRESERDSGCAGAPAHAAHQARPALLLERITAQGTRTSVSATELLHIVLQALTPIWRTGARVMGAPAGDVWPHRFAGGDDPATRGWVPLHAPGQRLCRALLPPLHAAGITVHGLQALTGLPAYANGGLLLDTGVLLPRAAQSLERVWKPGDEFIVEWRALTVTLLDELALLVGPALDPTAGATPLACALDDRMQAAGRELAAQRRGGMPPLRIDSDGTLL